ncbi:MAG: prephenate dehydratase [Gammaproteobacteria bacterium]|nr:prephenate dehydratase [Gammaproteobacteria bacterium]
MNKAAAADDAVTVGFLGPKGTFSQMAVLQHFGKRAFLRDFPTIDEVFAAVETGVVNYGVVPVENSTEGAINNTQDCLVDAKTRIVGEQFVFIEHNLLTGKGIAFENIHTIASHKQSLAQCRKWLQKNAAGKSLRECASNAEAAKLALENRDIAAIAGKIAAETYGLQILREAIQDQKHNSTRFLVLASADSPPTGKDKTSILVYTENKPGALFRILQPFEELQISLTKIETRPSKKEAWEYVFFIDFEGHREDEKIKLLFAKLKTCTAEIKILGSYPVAQAR